MEIALREAKARPSELVAAARYGEQVIITRHDRPAVKLVRRERRGGIDFDRLDAARRHLGLKVNGEQGRRSSTIRPAASRCSAWTASNRPLKVLLDTSYSTTS